MPLGMTSNRLYRAQRRRLRLKRWLAHSRLLSKGLLGLIVGAALVCGGYLLWPQVLQATCFRMQTIQITGVNVLPREEVLYLLAIPEDVSMLQLDLPRMGARLMHHPAIKAVTLRRRLPDTLIVTIEEHLPYLVLHAGEQRMVIDREGVVLRHFVAEKDAQLPELVWQPSHALMPGLRLQHREVHRAVELVQSFQASPLAKTIRLISLTVEPSGSAVWRVESYPFTVRVGEGQIEPQLERLPLVLQYIAQQGLAVQSIDLSYRRKVVVVPAS